MVLCQYLIKPQGKGLLREYKVSVIQLKPFCEGKKKKALCFFLSTDVSFFGLGGIWVGPSPSGIVYYGLTNQYSRLFGHHVLWINPDCCPHQVQSQALKWYGVVSVTLSKAYVLLCDGSVTAEKFTAI